MPSGKVKWYDTEKGFGFLTSDEGQDVFVHSSALPSGMSAIKPGTRVEFGVATGRRGAQALQVRLLEAPPSVVKNQRKSTEDMTVIVEDLIKMLDDVSNMFRRGKYPDRGEGRRLASVLRAVADDLDS